MTLEEVKARIRALQARTPAAGCTEAEAMAAAAAALRLMREHNLDPDQVACARASVELGRRSRTAIDRVWGRIGDVCRCQAWNEPSRDGLRLVYFGREPWPELAAWLHGVVQGAHDRAMREFCKSASYLSRRKKKTRTAARKAFSEGFVLGIRRKLSDLILPAEAEVRAADQAIAQRALDQLGMEFSTAKAPKLSTDRRFDGDRWSGEAAGRRTQLRWGVSSSGEQLAIEGPKG